MTTLEDTGFLVLCATDQKLTALDGAVIVGGAIVALGAGLLQKSAPLTEDAWISKSAWEKMSPKERKREAGEFADKLSLDAREFIYQDLQKVPAEYAEVLIGDGFFPEDVNLVAESWSARSLMTSKDPKDREALLSFLRNSDYDEIDRERILYDMFSRSMDPKSLAESLSSPDLPKEVAVHDKLTKILGSFYPFTHFERNDLRKKVLASGLSFEELERLGPFTVAMQNLDLTPENLAALRRFASQYDYRVYRNWRKTHLVRPTFENLVNLNKISPKAVEAGALEADGVGYLDWEETFRRAKAAESMPIEALEAAGVTHHKLLSLWIQIKDDEEWRKRLYDLSAIGQSLESSEFQGDGFETALELYLPTLSEKCLTIPVLLSGKDEDCDEKSLQIIKNLVKLAKSGVLKKYNDLLRKNDVSLEFWELRAHLDALANKSEELGSWKTYGELAEKIAKLQGFDYTPVAPTNAMLEDYRYRDRLAQRDPEWAISEYKSEYKRGKRIAPVMKEVAEYIRDLTRKGETIFIHGRDGELIYDLLKRTPGVDMKRVRYAITSRPLTTYMKEIPEGYRDYLGRMVPKGAVHIDTGFEGSIPAWLDKQGFEVKSIAMVSANRKEQEIPVSIPMTDQERRDLVLSDLEHSAQRLDTPSGWDSLRYSFAAPGYHARLYGVLDALGLQRRRIAQKTPETRFEEQARYRVASSETPEEVALNDDQHELEKKGK